MSSSLLHSQHSAQAQNRRKLRTGDRPIPSPLSFLLSSPKAICCCTCCCCGCGTCCCRCSSPFRLSSPKGICCCLFSNQRTVISTEAAHAFVSSGAEKSAFLTLTLTVAASLMK